MKTKIWIVLAPYCGTKHKNQTHIILAEGGTSDEAFANAFGKNANDAPVLQNIARRSLVKEVTTDEASTYPRAVAA